MFNLGITELIALGGLALLIIGPKQLPEVAKVVARVLGELKNATGDLTSTFTQVRDEAQGAIDDVVGELSDFSDPEALLNKAAGLDKLDHQDEGEEKAHAEGEQLSLLDQEQEEKKEDDEPV